MTPDQLLILTKDGDHHFFSLGAVGLAVAHQFQEGLSEALAALQDPETPEVHLFVSAGTLCRQLPRLPGEHRTLYCVNYDHQGLMSDEDLRRKLTRTLSFLARPVTPADPGYFVPTAGERIQA